MTWFLSIILGILTILLILIIMLQRGRGGGLAGALGGMGGQSAFGTRAGDVFTRITAYMALVWVAVACLTGWRMRVDSERFRDRPDEAGPSISAPADDKSKSETKTDEPADDLKPAGESKTEKPEGTSKESSGDEKAVPAKDGAASEKPAAKGSEPASDESKKKSE